MPFFSNRVYKVLKDVGKLPIQHDHYKYPT